MVNLPNIQKKIVSNNSVFSVLPSEYPDYSWFSLPNADYNSKIIRLYQFSGVFWQLCVTYENYQGKNRTRKPWFSAEFI